MSYLEVLKLLLSRTLKWKITWVRFKISLPDADQNAFLPRQLIELHLDAASPHVSLYVSLLFPATQRAGQQYKRSVLWVMSSQQKKNLCNHIYLILAVCRRHILKVKNEEKALLQMKEQSLFYEQVLCFSLHECRHTGQTSPLTEFSNCSSLHMHTPKVLPVDLSSYTSAQSSSLLNML